MFVKFSGCDCFGLQVRVYTREPNTARVNSGKMAVTSTVCVKMRSLESTDVMKGQL